MIKKKSRSRKHVEADVELIIGRQLKLAFRTSNIRIPKSGYLLEVARGKLKVHAR